MTDPIRFRLVTVCDGRTASDGTLAKMLASLDLQQAEARVWLVCHGVSARTIDELRIHPRVACVLQRPSVQPVSMARNRMIAKALEGAGERDVIAFPDDDCWYARGTLDHAAKAFAAIPSLGFILGRVSPDPDSRRWSEGMHRAGAFECLHKANCGSMMFRATALARMETRGAWFDEKLGLGTKAGSAEEPDLAYRAWKERIEGIHLPNFAVGHPAKPDRPAKYWRGNLTLLAKHAGWSPGLWKRWALRAGRGLKYAAAGEFGLGHWASSVLFSLGRIGDGKQRPDGPSANGRTALAAE